MTAISWSLLKLHGLLTGLSCALESFVTTPGSLRRSRTFAVPECMCHHICAWSTETKRNYHHIQKKRQLRYKLTPATTYLVCGCSSDWKMHMIGYSSPYQKCAPFMISEANMSTIHIITWSPESELSVSCTFGLALLLLEKEHVDEYAMLCISKRPSKPFSYWCNRFYFNWKLCFKGKWQRKKNDYI